jgi:hypothetical protein
MKKIILTSIYILGFFFSLVSVQAKIDTSVGVVRNIISKILCNKELQIIEVNKIIIQKFKNENTTAYTSVDVIYDAFDKKDPTQNEIFEYVKKYEFEFVYKSDIIFGHKVDLYLDLSNKQVTEKELNDYIEKAKLDVEKDFNAPPSFENRTEGNGYGYYLMIFVVIAILIIFAMILVKIRHR